MHPFFQSKEMLAYQSAGLSSIIVPEMNIRFELSLSATVLEKKWEEEI